MTVRSTTARGNASAGVFSFDQQTGQTNALWTIGDVSNDGRWRFHRETAYHEGRDLFNTIPTSASGFTLFRAGVAAVDNPTDIRVAYCLGDANTGQVDVLMTTGQLVSINDREVRQVARFTFTPTYGSHGAFGNDSGQFVFTAAFTDNTAAVFHVVVPEPAITAWLGLLLGAGTRRVTRG